MADETTNQNENSDSIAKQLENENQTFKVISCLVWRKIPWNRSINYNSIYFHEIIFNPRIKKICFTHRIRIKHNVEITEIYSNNLWYKNFVKVPILLKSWFDEIFFQWERIHHFFTLWKLRNFNASILLQRFREINMTLNWFDEKNTKLFLFFLQATNHLKKALLEVKLKQIEELKSLLTEVNKLSSLIKHH